MIRRWGARWARFTVLRLNVANVSLVIRGILSDGLCEGARAVALVQRYWIICGAWLIFDLVYNIYVNSFTIELWGPTFRLEHLKLKSLPLIVISFGCLSPVIIISSEESSISKTGNWTGFSPSGSFVESKGLFGPYVVAAVEGSPGGCEVVWGAGFILIGHSAVSVD